MNSLVDGGGQRISVPIEPRYLYLTNATIAKNQVLGFSDHSIVVGGGDSIVISGNVVTDSDANGIDCRASHSITECDVVHNCKEFGYNNAADFVQLRNNDLSGNDLGGVNIA